MFISLIKCLFMPEQGLLLVVGCWLLLVVGCWLLVVVGCCWLLVVVGCCKVGRRRFGSVQFRGRTVPLRFVSEEHF